MNPRPPVETSIGIFSWRGVHTKWECEESTLDDGLSINLDFKEIEDDHIEKIIQIYSSRESYFGLAMKHAKKELREYAADPEAMNLSRIGLSDELYPKGFSLVYDYPENVWPDGQLSVVFKKEKPHYCHSDD